jgi:hypothetical protein
MIELTGDDFERLCASGVVSERISSVEQERKDAVAAFWKRLLIGFLLAGAALWSLLASGWEAVAFIVFALIVIGTIVFAVSPVMAAKEGLKHPVLEELAKRGGMEFIPSEFTPPAFASAKRLLFGGGGFSSATFSDLFHGVDAEGRGYAVYEANLQRRSGKNSYTVFSGQIYALHRRRCSTGYTVIVPDKKLFNFWKPASDTERVRIEGDEEFERRFEVYSTSPAEARMLCDVELRRLLLELRETGRVSAYVGPDEALVAVGAKDRFEPGSMFRSRPGRDRVKMMFDDVCASLALLKRLKAAFG